MKGKDRVRVLCGGCGGSGMYYGPTPHTFQSPHLKNMEVPGHFECHGFGFKSILVSSARATARKRVKNYHETRAKQQERAEKAKQEKAERDRKKQELKAQMVQGFVGEPGDKVGGLTGTIIADRTYDSIYGYKKTVNRFLSIKLDNGQVVTTAGSGKTLFGPKRGDSVTIVSGTVKNHSNYEGQDQTGLTRVKLFQPES